MNLTLSVDAHTVEQAREAARQQGKSLNSLIRQYLESLAGMRSHTAVAHELDQMWKKSGGNSRGWRFDREELYAERLDKIQL